MGESTSDRDGLTQPLLSQSPTLRHFLAEGPPASPAPTPRPWSLDGALEVEGNDEAEAEFDKETQALLAEIRRPDGDQSSSSGLVRQRSEVRRKQRRFASSRHDSEQSSAFSSFSTQVDLRTGFPSGAGGGGDGWNSYNNHNATSPSEQQERQKSFTGREEEQEEGNQVGGWWWAPCRRRCLNVCKWPARKCSDMLGKAGGPLAFPFKAGLAATVASILCFLPPIYSSIDMNGVWAVVTVDMVLEASVGLTFSKGINRTLGTLVAALCALLVNLLAPSFGSYETYFILVCVFLGAAIPTVFKFRRPFKDKWNYAVVMSMITFHLLILSGGGSKGAYVEKLSLPLIRLLTIIIGFLLAALVNLGFAPHFAGDTVNRLVAKNFHTAGTAVDRCVRDYCQGTVLEPVPEVLRKKTPVDNIYTSFYEILAADSEVDKLMKAVPFEPCHGKFVWGFPWDLYSDIIDNLRYAIYDVIALDACLRAEIQAPYFVRLLFLEELQVIGGQAGVAMRLASAMLKDMRRYDYQDVIQRAEEAALLLQHKIRKYSRILLAEHGPAVSVAASASSASPSAAISIPPNHHFGEPSPTGGYSFTLPRSFPEPKSYQHQLSMDEDAPGSTRPSAHAAVHRPDWQTELFQKTESLGREWDGTIQRIASLSFVKFSSLLIEMVAKTKSILALVDEMGEKANYPQGDRRLTNAFYPDEDGIA